jgi:hypothetical protein
VSKFVESFICTLMRRNKESIRNHANIVNLIVNLHHVLRWGSHRRHLAVLTKIVTNKFAFLVFLFIITIC